MPVFRWLSIAWLYLALMVPMLMFSSVCMALEPVVAHEDVLQVNPTLSLHDVLNMTVKHQPQQAQWQAQRYGVKAKKALAESMLPYSPAISIAQQNDSVGSNRGEREYSVALELPIWLPNQRDARAKVAEISARYVEAGQASLAIRAAGLLRDALWGIALTKNAFALWISGEYLSVPASVGFIALLGIAVLNGVVMVSYFQQLDYEGMQKSLIAFEGAKRRLRPVLMTASISVFGLIPLLFATGPGSEIQRPLAVVVIGGLTTATLLTLFILPILYHRFFGNDEVTD